MNRLELLAARKAVLAHRAELERNELALHLGRLRKPAAFSYQGFKLLALLRSPVTSLLAARFGGGTEVAGQYSHWLRYAGYALAAWRVARLLRDLVASRRTKPSE